MIEFAHIELFWLLVLPFFMLLLPVYRQRQASVRVPFFDRVAELSGQEKQKASLARKRNAIQKFLVPMTWLCLVIVAAKPEWVGEPIEQIKSGRDLMISVDLSGSMSAEDFTLPNGKSINRLEAVKLVMADFVEERKHDRLGLILFADAPYLQVPFSEDKRTWLTLLNETEIGMAGQSTVLGDSIGLAIKLFENGESSNRTLIILTDGNDTGSLVPPVEAARIAAANDVRIYVIAVGDPETIGDEAMDMDTISAVVNLTGGQFFHALDSKQLEQASEAISKLEEDTFETLSYSPRTSIHYYPLVLVAILYLLFHSFMALQLTWQKATIKRVVREVSHV
jgi:Ca-activated chloride channel family protein